MINKTRSETAAPAAGPRVDRVVGPLPPNRGLRAHRLTNDPLGLETAFAMQWEKECRGQPSLNGGFGILDLLCSEQKDPASWLGLGFGARKPLIEIDDTHRAVVATVIQWLGTNVGRSFLDEAFKRAGYTLRYDKRPNVGGEDAPCGNGLPRTTTATPQGVASTD